MLGQFRGRGAQAVARALVCFREPSFREPSGRYFAE